MKISEKADYLVLSSTEDNVKGTIDNVFFLSDYEDVLKKWTHSTRMSPIYRLSFFDDENQTSYSSEISFVVYRSFVSSKIRSQIFFQH